MLRPLATAVDRGDSGATQVQPRERRLGFTLIELSIVMALIGVLASVAIPQFSKYVQRSRRAEAFYSLKNIHDLQVTHFLSQNTYSDSLAEIGFSLGGGSVNADGTFSGEHYTYSLQAWDFDGRPKANYRATATGDIDPSDAIYDIIIIENQLIVKN